MPNYCYVHPKTKEVIVQFHPMANIPESITIEDGTVCDRSLAAEIAGQGGHEAACWPQYSQSIGCHKDSIKIQEKFAHDNGVNMHFDSRGRAVFESREQRKAYCRIVKAVDYDGGYGDQTDIRKDTE